MLPLIITVIIFGIIYGIGFIHANRQRIAIKKHSDIIFQKLSKHMEYCKVRTISKGSIGTSPDPYQLCLDGRYKNKSFGCAIEKIPGNLLNIAFLDIILRSHQTTVNPPNNISPLKVLFPKKKRITPNITLKDMGGIRSLTYRKKIKLNKFSYDQKSIDELRNIFDELINTANKIGFE